MTQPDTAAPTPAVGKARPAIDGPLKVTGTARYASDHNFPGMLYAVPVGATIANGDLTAIDTARARQMPGVRAVFKRGEPGPDRPDQAKLRRCQAYLDERRPPFEDDVVRYYGQFVALVVADTFEEAKAAADAVSVSYATRTPDVDPHLIAETTKVVSERGDVDAAFAARRSGSTLDYEIASETHNPIETHATVAVWDGDELTLYETSQGVVNHRNVLAGMLGLPQDKVRVISRFIGSGFGSKLFPWTQSPLAAAAAMALGRPIKLVLSRPMMFHAVGNRPRTVQRLRLGAEPDGRLVSLQHDYVNATSILDDYVENCGEATPHMYSVPNLRVTSGLAKRHIGTPTSMRGPGAVPGLFALESAMDELAVALGHGPGPAPPDQRAGTRRGHGRAVLVAPPRGMPDARRREIRLGRARSAGGLDAARRADARLGHGGLLLDRRAVRLLGRRSSCATTARYAWRPRRQDIGTGTYTVLAQMAADALGIASDRVEVVLGDTSLPPGPLSGGSMLTASLVAPIHSAIEEAGRKLIAAFAASPAMKADGSDPEDSAFQPGLHPGQE